MLKLWKSFKKLFSFKFVHPLVNERVDHAITDKIKAHAKKQDKEASKYQDELNSIVRTYFSRPYETRLEMEVAFQECNRTWKKLCKEVNSTNKLINLNKSAFENQVKLVIKETQNGVH